MKIVNKRDFSIKISGNHYFACDYIFSNVYGESVFLEDDSSSSSVEQNASGAPPSSPHEPVFSPLSATDSEILDNTLPYTQFDGLSTMPDCTKNVEFLTEGSLFKSDENGLYIRYGDDASPMCIHILDNGTVTLSGNDCDVAEIVFENGKRNYIALSDSLFSEADTSAENSESSESMHSINLCVDTSEITNNMSEKGGSLSVRYSIEVNGMIAEVTDFTLTASNIGSCNQ